MASTVADMGPLAGVRVVELAGIGPGPHACMILADLGADVVRVDRPAGGLDLGIDESGNPMSRGRRLVAADLKTPEGRETVLSLIEQADVLVEGYRPGVTERLGVGPDDCWTRNPELVYARMTGWGQTGPLANGVGHDINYISLTGVLHSIGSAETPVVPLNLVGDFGGGSMLLVIGVLAALFEARQSGQGQVVDAAMVDGASLLAQMVYAMLPRGLWVDQRQSNLLDGAAPFYNVYRCADGQHVAVGAIEPQFYGALLQGLELEAAELPPQNDQAHWPATRERFAEILRDQEPRRLGRPLRRSRCLCHPRAHLRRGRHEDHIVGRQTVVERNGLLQVAPQPRFSRTAAELPDINLKTYSAEEVLDGWTAGVGAR